MEKIADLKHQEIQSALTYGIESMSLRGAELRGIFGVALYRNGGSFERKFIIPSGLIPDIFKYSLI